MANVGYRIIPREFLLAWEVGEHVRHKLPRDQQSMACAGICLGSGEYHEDFEHLGSRNRVGQGSCGVLSYSQDDPESQSFVVLEMG